MKCLILCYVICFLWTCANSCTTPTGQQSQCVSLYECPTLLAGFSLTPIPPKVVTFLRESHCGFDDNIPKVCCGPLPKFETTSNDIDADPIQDEDSSPAPEGSCGMDSDPDRIYGGQATDIAEFPWMALLGYRTRNKTLTYQCGGVLINHRYVLTAAHCVTGAVETQVGQLATVRLGEYDQKTNPDCVDGVCAEPYQEIPVQGAYPHAGYSDSNKNRNDDIAIVRLAKRAKFSYFVQPICLVDRRRRLAPGNSVVVAGWGTTLEGRSSPVKMKLTLPIFNQDECVVKYKKLGAQLANTQVCAGGNFAEDACRGDSGGPLMKARQNGVWEAVAIVSFGYGCGRDGWPGVYTSVAAYTDWIQSTLRTSNV